MHMFVDSKAGEVSMPEVDKGDFPNDYPVGSDGEM